MCKPEVFGHCVGLFNAIPETELGIIQEQIDTFQKSFYAHKYLAEKYMLHSQEAQQRAQQHEFEAKEYARLLGLAFQRKWLLLDTKADGDKHGCA